MSRHWSEHEYVPASSLWQFIDEQAQKIEALKQLDTVESSELCKLLLLGRQEILDTIATFVNLEEIPLKTIMTERHCVFTDGEIEQMIKEEYGL